MGLLALILIYLMWANGTLRRTVTAPILARMDINLLQKYGMTQLDFVVYQALLDRSSNAFSPEAQPTHAQVLWHYGKIYHPFDLLASGQLRAKGWEFTRLPGYLRDVGASFLLLDAAQWASFAARSGDPERSRPLPSDGEWHDDPRLATLFESLGMRVAPTPYMTRMDRCFEQPDVRWMYIL